MPGEDGAGEVVEATPAVPALVTLPLRFGLIPTLLDDLGGVAVGTAESVGPAKGTDSLVALVVVGDAQDVRAGGRPDVLGWAMIGAS
jgi:hypothetical protein